MNRAAMLASHRARYPEQYTHPWVGKRARVSHQGEDVARGIVERVIPSRWGTLVALDNNRETGLFYPILDCCLEGGDDE
jgi:hypothetical protein